MMMDGMDGMAWVVTTERSIDICQSMKTTKKGRLSSLDTPKETCSPVLRA